MLSRYVAPVLGDWNLIAARKRCSASASVGYVGMTASAAGGSATWVGRATAWVASGRPSDVCSALGDGRPLMIPGYGPRLGSRRSSPGTESEPSVGCSDTA